MSHSPCVFILAVSDIVCSLFGLPLYWLCNSFFKRSPKLRQASSLHLFVFPSISMVSVIPGQLFEAFWLCYFVLYMFPPEIKIYTLCVCFCLSLSIFLSLSLSLSLSPSLSLSISLSPSLSLSIYLSSPSLSTSYSQVLCVFVLCFSLSLSLSFSLSPSLSVSLERTHPRNNLFLDVSKTNYLSLHLSIHLSIYRSNYLSYYLSI